MLEVILDTETTGLSILEKHRIVEIGCVELNNQIPTDKIFHTYLNPQRSVSEDAYKIHGYSDEFLSNKKTFSEISEAFLNFIKHKKIKDGFSYSSENNSDFLNLTDLRTLVKKYMKQY